MIFFDAQNERDEIIRESSGHHYRSHTRYRESNSRTFCRSRCKRGVYLRFYPYDKARALEAELQAKGVKAKGFKFDVANLAACENMAAEVVKEFERIDIVVNNAGITRDNLLMRMTEEQFDEVITTNLKSVF